MEFSFDHAIRFVGEETAEFAGRVLGPPGDLRLGAGLFYAGVMFPVFNRTECRFQVRTGEVLVLTHECDVEQGNDKLFNSDLMIAPVAQLRAVYDELIARRSTAQTKAYLGDLVRCRISQLFYLPPWRQWPDGGVVYLNRIGHTHRNQLEELAPVAALTAFGYDRLGRSLQTHFLRPKDDRLPGGPGPIASENPRR